MTKTIQPREPEFSIVIPCYNRAATVAETIQSCLDQTDGDFEIIVVDDGSKDDLAGAIAAIDDARVRYVHQENGGGGKARNTGILGAVGRYIAFLDSDDFFRPDKLARVRAEIADTGANLIYSYVEVDRGPNRIWIKPGRPIAPGEDVGEYLFADGGLIQTSTLVVERGLATRVLFDPTLEKGQDLDFCVRLAHAGATFTCIREPLVRWVDRTHHGRTSHRKGAAAPLAWLARNSSLLTERGLAGYRATVLSYYLAPEQPLVALKDVVSARQVLGWSWGTTGRFVMRAFIPQTFYRRLVDAMIDMKRIAVREG